MNLLEILKELLKPYPSSIESSFSNTYNPDPRTEIASKRVKAKNEFYKGRHIIGHDKRINDGVYVGAESREAIVVDATDYYCQEKIEKAIYEYQKSKNAIGTVYRIVKETFIPDENKITKLIKGYEDKKISLGYFIKKGVGVCRHNALLAGLLLEQMIDKNLISGKVSVDRNKLSGQGAHAWCRYTSLSGEVTMIDPTLNYCGPLTTTPWNYKRPEEMNQR